MKYITLIPDYTQSCIQDDYNGKIELSDLNFPKSLVQEVEKWHQEYRGIIPLSEEQRLRLSHKIEQLDIEGLRLAEEIKKHFSEKAKVRYYSEGKYNMKNKVKEPLLLMFGMGMMFVFLLFTFIPKPAHVAMAGLIYLIGYVMHFCTLPIVWISVLSYVAYINLKHYRII